MSCLVIYDNNGDIIYYHKSEPWNLRFKCDDAPTISQETIDMLLKEVQNLPPTTFYIPHIKCHHSSKAERLHRK